MLSDLPFLLTYVWYVGLFEADFLRISMVFTHFGGLFVDENLLLVDKIKLVNHKLLNVIRYFEKNCG